ncbi:3-hydroxyisobutyryl-coenzyme A hydrolase [Phlebopus sp. FC_14]|nr:3-hydroxyisobutyryl-coenzyme A hydrolase [Phlebopus sp. FC_14]
MLATAFARMSRNRISVAAVRTRAIAAHMSTSTDSAAPSQPVLFESDGTARTYVLNRERKLNALNGEMISLLRRQLEIWTKSDLCRTIIGTGLGRAFCAGGDVARVLQHSLQDTTRPAAIEFFKAEFELDYIFSQLPKPYVAILDGITMGGGAGLAFGAPFRVATERTVFAMPETRIGYCPDVGASYYMSRLDGEVGTYLALTSERLVGREVFEHGLATHYVSSGSVPSLSSHIAEFEAPSFTQINRTIEELHAERQSDEPPRKLAGNIRQALDFAFRHDSVEEIFGSLKALSSCPDTHVNGWAEQTLKTLLDRSPTSLKVALSAIRRGKNMTLLEALQMELGIATAYCSGASTDFSVGISAVLIDKIEGRPAWSPDKAEDVAPEILERFFSEDSEYRSAMPELSLPDYLQRRDFDPMVFALPTETEVLRLIRSSCENGPVALSGLLSGMDGLCKRKFGTREKILDIVHRRCEVVDRQGTPIVSLKED